MVFSTAASTESKSSGPDVERKRADGKKINEPDRYFKSTDGAYLM